MLLASSALLIASALAAQDVAATWQRFPVFVWRQNYRNRATPEALVEVFGGVNVEADDAARATLARGLDFYVGHGPGRDVLHLERASPGYGETWTRFFDDRDASRLIRKPCLTSEATRALLFDTLARSLAARGGRHGIGVSLGDEISLTPWGDPLDLCHSPTCLAAWSEWCGDRDPLPYVATDDVRRALIDGDPSPLGPWLERREFHHTVLLELVEELAARVRAHPSAPGVGLLGCAGRSAFGGLAIDRVLPALDFIEAYGVADARELLFTLRRPEQRVLITMFRHASDASGDAGVAWQAWDQFARGGDGLIIWSDRVLEQHAGYHERLERAVTDIRAVRSALAERGLRHAPRTEGVALVNDWRSVAVGWMRDALLDGATWPRRYQGYQTANGTWETRVPVWLRAFEDAGAMPGALPLEAVDASTIERFPVLVLNHLWVLDESDLERLERFVRAGGTLWVDGRLGWIDAAGVAREEDAFTRLATLAAEVPGSGSVQRAPARLDTYRRDRVRAAQAAASIAADRGEDARSMRWQAATTAPDAVRDALAASLRTAGVLPPPVALETEPRVPLALRWTPGQRSVVVALPNWTEPAERAVVGARPLALRLASDPDPAQAIVTWLHPPVAADGVRRLAPGDAAVLVVERPRRD